MRILRILASLILGSAVLFGVIGCGGSDTTSPPATQGTVVVDDTAKLATFTAATGANVVSVVANFATTSASETAITGDIVFKLISPGIWTLQFNPNSTSFTQPATGEYLMTVYALSDTSTRQQVGLTYRVNLQVTGSVGGGPPPPPF